MAGRENFSSKEDRLSFLDLAIEEEDNGFMHEFLPYSDINRWIPENSVYDDVYHNAPLGRLGNVAALSFLAYIGPAPETQYFLDYTHDRLDHSLVVAMTSEEVLKNNHLPQKLINIAILAGLLHDIATPALGDATMQMDTKNLDEEENWAAMLDEKGMELLEKYGVSKKEMHNIIKNKGTLGVILDITDRITYTMKDLFEVAGSPRRKLDVNPYTKSLHAVLNEFPDVGNIYKDVAVDPKTEQVYFTNPERLEAFLLLRALLHQKLYLHPISQGRDLLVKKLLEPLYSSDEKVDAPLNPTSLRAMNDTELKSVMYGYFTMKTALDQLSPFRDSDDFFYSIVNWFPEYRGFETEKEASEFISQLSHTPSILTLGMKRRRGFDPGVGYLVMDPKTHTTMPFSQSQPQAALQLQQIADSLPGIFVYFKDISENEEKSRVNNFLRAVKSEISL
ncbi:MAG: hypothetical protein COU27_03390 [Candidatus Levybacteria bacterium CG10_big_fil_rev_8_21_14_0_10_36_7]|nr:MAG: hypothetical protein COU27_03390 [Candidatus Levybacteria bacterium CG10_big_fil_rev_8_21_14_0_10_36_7]